MSRMTPTAPITLDRVRTMRLDFEALRKFKHLTGLSILLGQLDGNVHEGTLPELVLALTAHEDPELTVERATELVGDAFAAGTLPDLLEAVGDFLRDGLREIQGTDGEEGEDEEDPPEGEL